jgi:hypothetical protein
MPRVITLSLVLVFASVLAYAESFTGKLVDANCAAQQPNAACGPSASTTAFALQVSGKMLKFDAEGNKKAAEALKDSNSSADRAKDPKAEQSQVTATVEGKLEGDEIKVETIAVR